MSVCKMDTNNCNQFVDHYKTLVDRSEHVEVLELAPIEQCFTFVRNMYMKAQDLDHNDKKLVLYLKIVKYVSNLTNHPTWSTVNKKEKEKMEQISIWAYTDAMFVKKKIMDKFIRGGKMANSKRSLGRSATVYHLKSQISLDGDRNFVGRATFRRATAPDSQLPVLDIPLTYFSRPESSRPTTGSCLDTDEVFPDGDRPSMGRSTPMCAMPPYSQPLDIPLTNTSRPESSRHTAKSFPDTEEVFPHINRFHDVDRPSSVGATPRSAMAPKLLDIPLTYFSKSVSSRPISKSCPDTKKVFRDVDQPSMGGATPMHAKASCSQPLDIPLTNTSRPESSTPTVNSCPDGDRPISQMRRSVSQPSVATFWDNDDLFCSVCEKKKQSLVAKIICTCKLKFNKHTQTNETKDAHSKRYDALLLYYETGDVIGSKLLQRLTAKGYNICTLQRENVLGEQITKTYTNLILDSRYVIAIVSAELLNEEYTRWVLNRAFDEGILRNYNFLLPIVLDNCELPETMKTIGSLKISSNNNTTIDEIYERLLVDFCTQGEGANSYSS